jgi:hypothetical protein
MNFNVQSEVQNAVHYYYLSVCHKEIAGSEYVMIVSTLFTISATFSLQLNFEIKNKQMSL